MKLTPKNKTKKEKTIWDTTLQSYKKEEKRKEYGA